MVKNPYCVTGFDTFKLYQDLQLWSLTSRSHAIICRLDLPTGGGPFWLIILAAPHVGPPNFGSHSGVGRLWLPSRWLSPNTWKYSFLPHFPYLHDFSLMFLMLYSPFETALLLVLMQPSGDGYFGLCSSKSSFRGTVIYAQILRFCKKNFDRAPIGGDTVIPLGLRLSRIEFSLAWDLANSSLA